MSSSLRESLSLSSPSSPRHDAMLSDSIHVLTETDRWDIEELFVSLDLDSRCRRFGYAASDRRNTHRRRPAEPAADSRKPLVRESLLLPGACERSRGRG